MNDIECIAFLQECLPRLRFRWSGFRRVRGQVCKRLNRRRRELNLPNLAAYRKYLEGHPGEWEILDFLCRITISRFYRNRGVFDALRYRILPDLAKNVAEAGRDAVRCWCAGCCSGEEAYTLQIIWKIDVIPKMTKGLPLRIIATDMDPDVLERARRGVYLEGSLFDLPEELIAAAFLRSGKTYTLKESFKEDVTFEQQDIRRQLPVGTFSLVFCRNLVLTYFEKDLQREILGRIFEKLEPGGIFVAGAHERLPNGIDIVFPYDDNVCIFRKA
ncbi:MAG: Chemotaxis protein methyltransferase [Syntrophus sp. PtaB.Bin001]|nr:MAG: Chemotaxis protein methyltransferase [Syntrophus sp. PtaB.Bin001]